MKKIYIDLAVEDDLSEAILRQLLKSNGDKFEVRACHKRGGFGYFKKRIHGFNAAAKIFPFFVLTDLDKEECPPVLIKEWGLEKRNPNLIFRIAVREVEAWLLADKTNFASYIGVSKDLFVNNVEKISDPKQALINLARRSHKRKIKDSLVPEENSTAKIGKNYNPCLIDFVNNKWDYSGAAKKSPSLMKALEAIRKI